MMTEDQQALRLKCLELALQAGGEPVDQARRFYAFASGVDEKTPRQVIIEALERAGVR